MPVYSGTTEIKGVASQFADKELYLVTTSNPFTGATHILDTLKFDSQGFFLNKITIDRPIWTYITAGIFKVHLYIEPGKGYLVDLPPNIPKTEADIRDPFYQPVTAHTQVLEEYPLNGLTESEMGEDINTKIFRFDTLVSAKNSLMKEAYIRKKTFDSDSLIQALESLYVSDSSEYFRKYRLYRYGILKINSRDVGLQYIFDNFLVNKKPETGNPAYMELFAEMYKEFLFYFSRTEEGKELIYMINHTHSATGLMDILMKHPAIPGPEMAEAVILEEALRIYPQDYFYRSALEIILDSIALHPVSKENAVYAGEIKNYLTRLKPGNQPPAFQLLDMKGLERSLEDFRGKYVYLNFCTPDNYSCLKEFPFMRSMHEKHNKYLEIVTVMVTEEIGEMQSFMYKNEYNWTALFYGNNDKLLSDYKIIAFPTCYLIDRDGTLIKSPANLATEGFEQQLFGIMRARGDL
jgi:peroxiredoxin